MANDESASRTFRIVAAVTAILAAIIARKALKALWKFVTGEEPPVDPESTENSMGRAVVWAMASGMAIGAARLVAARGLATTRRKKAPGEEPAETI